MKRIVFAALLCVAISLTTTATAQVQAPSVLSGAGDTFSNATVSLSWTLGETSIAIRRSPILELTEGFQQPALHIVTTTEPILPFSISLHPNPTKSTVNVALLGLEQLAQLRMYNLLGEKVAVENVDRGNSVVNLSLEGRPSGMYMLLIVQDDGQQLAQYKIIKAE